jgi:hypothetical protein
MSFIIKKAASWKGAAFFHPELKKNELWGEGSFWLDDCFYQ